MSELQKGDKARLAPNVALLSRHFEQDTTENIPPGLPEGHGPLPPSIPPGAPTEWAKFKIRA